MVDRQRSYLYYNISFNFILYPFNNIKSIYNALRSDKLYISKSHQEVIINLSGDDKFGKSNCTITFTIIVVFRLGAVLLYTRSKFLISANG